MINEDPDSTQHDDIADDAENAGVGHENDNVLDKEFEDAVDVMQDMNDDADDNIPIEALQTVVGKYIARGFTVLACVSENGFTAAEN